MSAVSPDLPRLLLAPMEGLLDARLRAVVTQAARYDWCVTEFIRVTGTVLPDLQRRAGITAAIRSRTLRTWGESESRLAELLAGRIDELDRTGGATLAFLASGIEGLKVRITAKARRSPRVQGRWSR